MTPVILAVALLCPPGPQEPCRTVARPQPSMAACRARLAGVVDQMLHDYPGEIVRGRPWCAVLERPDIEQGVGGGYG